MDLDLSESELAFQAEARAWLAAIVPAVNRVIAAARQAGCLIIHTRQGYRAPGS